jgi:glutathione S-transferase
VLELFQITGSCSFAARAALEEARADYVTVDVHPRWRDETLDFATVNPLQRVPSLRDGNVHVYETGAVLLYLVERLPGSGLHGTGLGPLPGEPGRGELLRWVAWLSNTLHVAYHPLNAPQFLTDEEVGNVGIRRKGRENLDAHGAYLECELAAREWCLGEVFSVADIYLYMLKGWESYTDGYTLGGPELAAHYARVGSRPAIARTRALDDLDERLIRHHPELRAGKPIA